MKKVIIAISGGVDSSVAAAILKNKGYNVVAVFMKFWKDNLEAEKNARKVAKKLNIPFHIIDVKKEFKKRVVDCFIKDYEKGKTPNPCVQCNKYIKFKFLFKKALEMKADFIATGHYARIKNNQLFVAKDKKKDQSYFLWNLKNLDKILFPVGDYEKREIRKMAEKLGLDVCRDSQEICFINKDISSFLKKRIKNNNGDIILNGKKIGKHNGLHFYTIGQRKGINIGGIGPFYVVKKNYRKNELIVAQSNFNEALYKKEMKVNKVNWINKPSKFPFKCRVKIRYLASSVICTIYETRTTRYKIRFSAPQRAVTSSQSAVFYKKNKVLGGGIIM